MQALMLAAGMGSRLNSAMNKCMVEVDGISLFERFVSALKKAEISDLIMVTGYQADELENFATGHADGINIRFIRNADYATTNNIWSLYLAQEYFSADDTILLESDLIYSENLLNELAGAKFSNVAVVAELENWMDGTTVLLEDTRIVKIVAKKEFDRKKFDSSYKTVNIYKFNKTFICRQFVPALEARIMKYGKNQYYEMALKDLVLRPDIDIQAFIIGGNWYEIDTPEDLQQAEHMIRSRRESGFPGEMR